MAGILKPEGAGAEASYKIWGYNLYDPAENLFNGSYTAVAPPPYAGTYQHNLRPFAYWYTQGDYLDIEFYSDVNIYDAGQGAAGTASNPLKVYKNEDGVQGEYVKDTLGNIFTGSSNTPSWTLIANLLKGRYRIERGAGYRASNDWYLEKLTTDKILLLSENNGVKSFDDSGVIVDVPDQSEESFIEYGMNNFANVDYEKLYHLGDTMEVLYYTDDPNKSNANLEITANYSPLDEIDENFEVVTWTDEEDADRALSYKALPVGQVILSTVDFSIKEAKQFILSADVSEKSMIRVGVSSNSGATWRGRDSAYLQDATSFKEHGFSIKEVSSWTEDEIKNISNSGFIRFQFYLEEYSMDSSALLHYLSTIEEGAPPSFYVSRDNGVSWMKAEQDTLTRLSDLPEGDKLRVKVVLVDGQELHALSYSWI